MMKQNKKKGRTCSTLKYILCTVLSVISVFLLSALLLICMTARYYVKKADIPKTAVFALFQTITVDLPDGSADSLAEYLLDEYIPDEHVQELLKNDIFSEAASVLLNKAIEAYLYKGMKGFLLRTAVSVWTQMVCGLLLTAVLFALIRIHQKENRKTGTAFKIYSITAGIPCTIIFIFSLLLSGLLELIELPSGLETAFRGHMVLFSGCGIVLCAGLFLIGIFWNMLSARTVKKLNPEEIQDIDISCSTERQFCRYCGQKLISPGAQFCYHCGKTQKTESIKNLP